MLALPYIKSHSQFSILPLDKENHHQKFKKNLQNLAAGYEVDTATSFSRKSEQDLAGIFFSFFQVAGILTKNC